ncbi:MAG TPA: hemerythrin domain-containing protein [Catalimonadaceae bacterium]|nr:hemerythrin domain-containing protein [Catalimonadaceae bacterium]
MNQFPLIGTLVKENSQLAEMLHQLGIKFYQEANKTLDQVCAEKGIDPAKVFQHFELLRKNQEFDLAQLAHYPVEILVSLLRHSHQLFIKQKLPFLFQTIAEMDENRFFNPDLARDLKMVFPIFAEDFIKHIFEEEDTLFEYIALLLESTREIDNPGMLFFLLKTKGIRSFSMHHEAHSNEMEGIRSLTDNYAISSDADLFTFILFKELQDFEEQLRKHAQIENNLLFPKALHLENEVRWRLDQIRLLN